ncbi:hypothetical protein AB0I28_33670 [Phytomonospora sp. NPDC050363]|uniref:hypothetical protein n=1 Tax=Phytomonospora sp. NPDC050363 TaxID=3155642 RepID=UPI0033DD6FE0
MPIPEEEPTTGPDGRPVSTAGEKFIAHNGPEAFEQLGARANSIKWDLEGRNVKQPLEAVKGNVFGVSGAIGPASGGPGAAPKDGRNGGMFGEVDMGDRLMARLGRSMTTLYADLQKVWQSADYLGATLPEVGREYAASEKVNEGLVAKVQTLLDANPDPSKGR